MVKLADSPSQKSLSSAVWGASEMCICDLTVMLWGIVDTKPALSVAVHVMIYVESLNIGLGKTRLTIFPVPELGEIPLPPVVTFQVIVGIPQ
jgi:hypothetical protein